MANAAGQHSYIFRRQGMANGRRQEKIGCGRKFIISRTINQPDLQQPDHLDTRSQITDCERLPVKAIKSIPQPLQVIANSAYQRQEGAIAKWLPVEKSAWQIAKGNPVIVLAPVHLAEQEVEQQQTVDRPGRLLQRQVQQLQLRQSQKQIFAEKANAAAFVLWGRQTQSPTCGIQIAAAQPFDGELKGFCLSVLLIQMVFQFYALLLVDARKACTVGKALRSVWGKKSAPV